MFIDADEIAELIETEQYPVHTEYHEKLKNFLEPNDISTLLLKATTPLQDVFNGLPPPPPKPKRQYAFCRLLGAYACALLSAELRVTSWADEAGAMQRAEDLKLRYVYRFDTIVNRITHHASQTQMRTAIKQVIQEWVQLQIRPFLPPPTAAPLSTGQQIRALRTEAKLTVSELANEVKITPRNIHRHESGDTKTIRATHIRKYESVFSEVLKRKIVLTKTSY